MPQLHNPGYFYARLKLLMKRVLPLSLPLKFGSRFSNMILNRFKEDFQSWKFLHRERSRMPVAACRHLTFHCRAVL
jgi:hypothetical protein